MKREREAGRSGKKKNGASAGLTAEQYLDKWTKGRRAVSDPELYKSFIKQLPGGKDISTNFNQFKFPVGTHETALDETLREDHNTTRYEASMQYLRWISSHAYAWLTANGKRPEEVQALWDGHHIYLCENDNNNTDYLLKHGWDPNAEVSLDGITDLDLRDRLERHIRQLQELEEPPIVFAAFLFVTSELNPMHAEVRLVEYWADHVAEKGADVFVAGLKRPCLACFARLLVLERKMEKKGFTLNRKPRPGLFWPSQSALKVIGREAALEILQHIESYSKHYLTRGQYKYDSDSDNESDYDEAFEEEDDEDERLGVESGSEDEPVGRSKRPKTTDTISDSSEKNGKKKRKRRPKRKSK